MFASKDTLLTRPSGYNIARSVRTRASASGNFTRTLSTPTDSTKFTFSAWIKRGSLSSSQGIFQAGNTNYIQFGSGDTIQLVLSNTTQLTTTAVFRDPSAWGHLVFSYNNAVSPKWNFYYNNVNIGTSTASNTTLNTATAHGIANPPSGGGYFDGYLTEINFIDGQALTPSSFGETDSITGVWKPKAYSGTYGTNGFELNFSDNSNNTAATIGKDYSGNGNNWTPNNISVTAGATYDSMTDVPTLTSATAANYPVWNPLGYSNGGGISNGNLTYAFANNLASVTMATPTTGKWYWETTVTSASGAAGFVLGIFDPVNATGSGGVASLFGAGVCYYNIDGTKYVSGSNTAYGASYTTGNIIGVALNIDSGTVTFYKDNTSQGAITLPANTGGWVFQAQAAGGANSATLNINFGQRPFSYTPPSGYVALNTFNLPDSTIKNGAGYMAATTYTGNGSTQTITNTVGSTSFQPDFVWIKDRNTARGSMLFDSVRGIYIRLRSNTTDAEQTETDTLTAFNSNGFNLSTNVAVNGSTETYVGWQWKAGTTSASNTNGSITSTVSAGATQGFSVVTYTGTGSSATVGHGLGVAPSMIICKARGQAENWAVYHSSLSNAVNVAMFLNLTNAVSGASNAYWNSTAPSSTVFSVNTATTTNAANTMVAYCFAPVAGYSAFGSYTGNGSTDGPFLYTGFRPRFVMIKRTDTTGNWEMHDTSRATYNADALRLWANLSSAEDATEVRIDELSNGFKLRTGAGDMNVSAGTYIYMAFAENPFKNSLAR